MVGLKQQSDFLWVFMDWLFLSVLLYFLVTKNVSKCCLFKLNVKVNTTHHYTLSPTHILTFQIRYTQSYTVFFFLNQASQINDKRKFLLRNPEIIGIFRILQSLFTIFVYYIFCGSESWENSTFFFQFRITVDTWVC